LGLESGVSSGNVCVDEITETNGRKKGANIAARLWVEGDLELVGGGEWGERKFDKSM